MASKKKAADTAQTAPTPATPPETAPAPTPAAPKAERTVRPGPVGVTRLKEWPKSVKPQKD